MVQRLEIDENALAKKLRSLLSPQKHAELNSILRKLPPSSELKGKVGPELLHFAAKHNNVELLEYLVDSAGVDVDAKNSYGTTPIVTAALYNHYEAVQSLLDANASLWITNSAGRTPLQVVMDKRRKVSRRVVRLFLERLQKTSDADEMAEMLEKLNYPMDLVVHANNGEVTRAMLRRKEPVSERHSRLLVERAVQSASLENLTVLLQYGAGRDSRKAMFVDALVAALKGSREELASFEPILRRLDRLKVIDENLVKVFRDVYREGRTEVVKLLVECQIHRIVSDEFKQDLLPCVFTNPNVDLTELPFGDEFDVNARGENGSSALHLAATCASEKSVLFLLERGADPNVKDDEGRAPLHVADSEKCIEHLLHYGADVEAVVNSGSAYRKLIRFECVLARLAVIDAQQTPIRWQIRDAVSSRKESRDFYEECRSQIGWMRTRAVAKNVTLFSVLVGDAERMAYYVRSREVVAAFLTSCGKRGLNRYYVALLTRKLSRALEVNDLKTRAVDAVSRLVPLLGSNRALIEKIVCFLSYRELLALASVRKEIS